MSDEINHPAYYNHGRIEVISAIEDWGLDFNLGNVIKYIARCDGKGEPLKDLMKARWYLNREIARREGKTNPTVETRAYDPSKIPF